MLNFVEVTCYYFIRREFTYEHILKRDRVNKILTSIFDYPLTVITAPMGYGKSTSVSEFLSECNTHSIWISLNEACKGTGYFWTVLTGRIAETNKELAGIMEALGFPSDNMQKARLFDSMSPYFKDNTSVLILDDYHYAENDLLNEFLISLSLRQISGLHIVVISRYMLKTSMTELVLKKLLYEIDMNMLRFTDSEVSQYFAYMSFPLSKEKVQQIQDAADGWVAAIYLIYRGLKNGVPTENISDVHDLIRCALYENYNIEEKKTLCSLSLLENFSVEFAEHSTGIQNLPEILSDLSRENAFINLDLITGTYSIHNVFRGFLLNESQNMGIDKKGIYRRAGHWFSTRHNFNQSFYYFYKGEDFESMLIELEKPQFYIKSADRPMLFYYFDLLPNEIVNHHPMAYLKYIHTTIVSGNKERGSLLLAKFEEKIPFRNYKEEDRTEIEATVHWIKIFLTFNNLEIMLEHTQAVIEILKGRVPLIASYQGPFSFGSPHLIYIYYKESGTFKKISELNIELYSQVSGGAGLGSGTLITAEYALETGDFNQVEVNALKTVYKAKTKNQTSMVICASLTLARLYILQNRYPEAMSLLNDLNEEVYSNVESILINTYELCLGYIYSCTGEYDKIPKWIKEGNMTINSLLMQGTVFSYVVYGKALILSGNWAKAEALCESFIPYFGIFNNQLGYIHNYIHLAIILHKRGNMEKSKSWLKKALEIGQKDDVVMPFAENGSNLLPILHLVEDESNDYIKKLIHLCNTYSKLISSPNFYGGILTPRETEILKLLSKGMSRFEVAENLFISAATVRTHTQNIYIKLGVNKKGDALKKANELHII